MPLGQPRGARARPGSGAPSLRLPIDDAAASPAIPSDRLRLRIALSKGLLGLELDAPYLLGPLRVVELALALPNVRFPVDLSGGVARFRHRRGALMRLGLEASTADLSAWAAPRLRGLLDEHTPDVVLAPIAAGALVGLRRGGAALAFDVAMAPLDGDLRLVPERARGLGIGAPPPQVLALRALAALAGPGARLVRGSVVIPDAVAVIARRLLPDAGARAPSARGVRWEVPTAAVGCFAIEARAGAPPAELPDRALRALEVAEIAGDADEAALAGDLEGARRLYLTALERAPRHREIAARLAWIDATKGDRPEGALSALVEAQPATSAGVLGGLLLRAVGDHDGARSAFGRGAEAEPYGPLAGLAWLEAARLAGEIDVRLEALDEAVARAPALEEARWARLAARLDLADVRGAKGDADQLEAATRGPDARLAVWRRAAEAFLARGFVAEAGELFERALRYAPDDAAAVMGLGRSLRAAGQERRALDLFARAVALATRAGKPSPAAEIELGRGLAEIAGDRPAAVARVRAIPPGLMESFEARFLEGRWRAELGDLAGAAIAFGRLRDAVEIAPALNLDTAASVAAMLVEAAETEEREREDLHAAQRDLGLAMRLRPRDRAIGAAFRRVAAEVVRGAPPAVEPAESEAEEVEEPSYVEPAPHTPRRAAAPMFESEEAEPAAEDEMLVEQLTQRVRANPSDHAAAMELAGVLDRLGRDLDLLALLSARLEEGDAEARREVEPLRRAVLLRIAASAREEGRVSEAELYELMAESDPA